jgi:outer membrane lipase/esterase
MTRLFLRRAMHAAALTCAFLAPALLVGCGGGTIESAVKPAQVIAFGDGISDVGNATGVGRYTVNDGSGIWVQRVAESYGVTLTSAQAGGRAYARGNARVLAKPDAAGSNATPSVKEQIDSYLGSTGGAVDPTAVLLIGAGYSDVIAEMAAFTAGTNNRDQLIGNVKQAGRDLGAQVRRLVAAGGKYVLVAGTYNIGKSPWATATNQSALLAEASSAFNDQFLISVVDLGANVLYVDAALQFNLILAEPSAYGVGDTANPACASVDAGPGIGIGLGQVSSALCNTSTIASGKDYRTFLFADRVYLTPRGQQILGDYATSRIRTRW